jgi:hypothetical protein
MSAGLDLYKLAKVLAMAGSQHDGERANAAALADRMRRAAGLTWAELLNPTAGSSRGSGDSAAWQAAYAAGRQAGYAAGLAAATKETGQRSKATPGGRWEDDGQAGEDRWEEFAGNEPDLAEWITEKADRGQEFAKSLRAGVCKFGSLTPKQEAAVRRNIAREKEHVW